MELIAYAPPGASAQPGRSVKQAWNEIMKIEGNTVLVTGGASGIGLSIAKVFLENRNTVIICGRNINKLDWVKKQYPDIHPGLVATDIPRYYPNSVDGSYLDRSH